MLNSLRKAVFGGYLAYIDPLPIPRGKVTIARVLRNCMGRAIYDVHGVRMYLDPTANMDKALIAGKGHDESVHQLLDDKMRDGGVFIDIGANMGYFSLLAAKMPGVDVLAFEPSPRELKRFYQNLIINNLPGTVTVYPVGLSDSVHDVSFHLSSDANAGMNTVLDLNEYVKYVETIKCRFVPFDTLVSPVSLERARLCKIDVEGYEISVLKGLEKSMPALVNTTFVIEISPTFLVKLGQRPRDIYCFFEKYGLRPRYGLDENKFQYDEVFER